MINSQLPAAFACCLLILFTPGFAQVMSPIEVNDRTSFENIQLTAIGKFGLIRKARPAVPSHIHTGIDIRRPVNNYNNEPIYPIAKGVVISKRTDGPFAILIVVHERADRTFWTVYEHIAGICVEVGDAVDPSRPIARFMNRGELDRYGWQFDHFHFEVLKKEPKPVKPDRKTPSRIFDSYTLDCHTPEDLNKYFYEPIRFLKELGN